MDDDEQEMVRLRRSKKHQAFEKKYDRAGARIIKQLHLQQSNNTSPSPSPSIATQSNTANNNSTSNNNDTPLIITPKDIETLPTSFGKKKPINSADKSTNNKTKVDFSEDFKDTTSDNNELESHSNKYYEHVISKYSIPMKYVAKLKGHNKLISTMCLDRSGTRLLTGSYDYTVKFWDFGGMNENLECFRSITPHEGYCVRTLEYNESGSMFLCCTTSNKAKIYDRDGRELMEFKSGDMYLRDLNHTFGHTMPLNGGKWFSKTKSKARYIATWSQDSTFRIWDIEHKECKRIIKARNKTGKRISVCSADFNSSFIVFGCNDGSIQLFDEKSHCKRPNKIISGAHIANTDISHIMFDKTDSNYFLSRGGMNDNTLKIWDIRNLSDSQPIKCFDHMWNITSLSNIILSPNRKLYITVCSASKDAKIGRSMLCLIDKETLKEIMRIPISNKAINNVLWHNKINQMFIGGNDCSVRVYYEDEPQSKNGVLLCAKRKYKKKHIDEQVKYFKIINPNALRVYKRQSQINEEKRKKDLLLHKPMMPHYGIGVQGRINTESFTHHVYKSQEKNVMSQVDPRDRLLLFNDIAVQDQQFTAIYNINQPHPVFQEKDEHELEANSIVSKLYTDMPGARQYNTLDIEEPPKKKQKT